MPISTNTTSTSAELPTALSPEAAGSGGARITGERLPHSAELLPSEVLGLLAELHRQLEPKRQDLLAARDRSQALYDAGARPELLPQNTEAVTGDWRVAEIPQDLRQRRVEITGPVNDPKMVIKMLGPNEEGICADTAMLDFEDSMKPTWANVIAGHHNVREAIRGTLEHSKPAAGGRPAKVYALPPDHPVTLMVRIRGLHLDERHLEVDGQPVAAGLFDLALTLFHGAALLRQQGRTPIFYVPKCEHHLEARWWNRLFELAQHALELPLGTLRATFLIETLPAAFQIEEILYEIRQHAAGLNVGRWDKIFSDIKVLKNHPDRLLADRSTIGLNRPWMRAYARRLVQICHRRGAYAIGGMAAFTPGSDEATRLEQTRKVVEDKQLEASLGHDGCWVSHPYFIGPALQAFPEENQLHVQPDGAGDPLDLLPAMTPPHTLEGLRTNLRVGIAYLEGWSRGLGCVAWDGLMEDLATLEISRAQTWQWLHHGLKLDDGPRVERQLIGEILDQELARIHDELKASGLEGERLLARWKSFAAARGQAEALFTEDELRPFLGEIGGSLPHSFLDRDSPENSQTEQERAR